MNATPSHLSRALCQYRHCTRSQVTVCRRLQNPRMEGSPSSAAAAAVQPAFNARGGSSKEKGKTLLVIDAAAAAAAAASAASAEFEAAKVAVGKLKAKALVEVCQLKNAPPAVRQLLHAACAALGERVWQCVCVYGGGGVRWGDGGGVRSVSRHLFLVCRRAVTRAAQRLPGVHGGTRLPTALGDPPVKFPLRFGGG